MDIIGNPFGAPPPQPVTTTAADNPFGVSVVDAPPPQQNPWGAPPPQQNANESIGGYSSTHSTQSNPFGAPPPTQPSNHGMQSQLQYQSPYQAPPQNQQGYPMPPQSNNPFGAPQFPTSAVVVATNQSNPYSLAPPYQYGQQHQGQIVPTNQQVQPWSLPQQSQQYAPQGAAGFDPFAQPPPPAPPAPAPESVSHEIDLFLQPQQQSNPPHPEIATQEPPEPPAPPPAVTTNGHVDDPPLRRSDKDDNSTAIKEAPDVAAPPQGTMYPPQIQYGQRPDVQPDPEPTHASPRNPYAPVLAREAPPGASPLPKAELVRKRGFALSRISFRTIVMKKWKQTYWVQYGPHTMLWFRSQADFDDWLNNPYHMQTERNFLIKLAVNFVHDLYKPNVRGYQVTQCRTKGYGNKVVRQFKLERWMDYGPTIAAAFGSYDPVEVDTLREAIVECMRNTPLEGGIRATGAVRQPNPNSSVSQRRERDDDDGDDEDDDDDEDDGRKYTSNLQSNDVHQDAKPKEAEASISEEADLLDVNNWDDVPSEPQQHILSNPIQQNSYVDPNIPSTFPNSQAPYGAMPQQPQPPVYTIQPYGGSDTNPYGMPTQPQYAPQQPSYSTAIVPASNPSQSYPGAQPQQLQQQQWMPPHQQQYQQQGYPQQPQVNYPQQTYQNPQQQPTYQQQADPWANPQPSVQMQPPQY